MTDRFDRADGRPRNDAPLERAAPARDRGTVMLPPSRRYVPTELAQDAPVVIACASCPATLRSFARTAQARAIELEAAGFNVSRSTVPGGPTTVRLLCAKCGGR